jgi:hypothetical protein
MLYCAPDGCCRLAASCLQIQHPCSCAAVGPATAAWPRLCWRQMRARQQPACLACRMSWPGQAGAAAHMTGWGWAGVMTSSCQAISSGWVLLQVLGRQQALSGNSRVPDCKNVFMPCCQ